MNLDTKRIGELMKLQNTINYIFKDINILNNALTHSSYIASRSDVTEYNERLEFIGDSILSMIISLYLYSECSTLPEGQLTRIRATIVCEQSLYQAAIKINLGKYLLLSKGEENTGGRSRASILADAFEALIAAVYLDGGMEKAKSFVLSKLKEIVNASIENKIFSDYKSYIQEYIQKSNGGELSYKLLSEDGPDHNKTFEMALYLNSDIIGTGSGHSKKDAQQAAARNAIENLGVKYE